MFECVKFVMFATAFSEFPAKHPKNLPRDAIQRCPFPIIPHRAEAVWSSPAALDGHSGMKSIAVLHLERVGNKGKPDWQLHTAYS